jgi:hypothetical protein
VTADISSTDQCSRTVYNYRKADFDHLRRLLEILPWSLLSDCTSVDESVDLFYDLLFSAINGCVPKVNVKQRKHPDWFDIDIVFLGKRRGRGVSLESLEVKLIGLFSLSYAVSLKVLAKLNTLNTFSIWKRKLYVIPNGSGVL